MIAVPTIAIGSIALLLSSNKGDIEESKKLLLNILDDLKQAYIPIYVHSYNLYVNSVRELRDKQNSEDFVRSQVQAQSKPISFITLVDDKTHKADAEICEKYDISVDQLGELLSMFEKEPAVQEMQSIIEENNQNIFKGIRPDFKLEYPDKITSELYFEILGTIFEVVRYETYCRIRYRMRENGGSKIFKLIFRVLTEGRNQTVT
jgi:hypothetical protein